jgi:large subunit ribosomal protein L17
MRHRKAQRKLGRTASHRKALLENLTATLFVHKHIRTTLAKAKEVRGVAERLITFAKSGTLADRRQVLRAIPDKKIVKSLFTELAPTYQNRNGGYTRFIKLGRRRGDGAEMAILELVGFEEVQVQKQKTREEAKAKKEKRKQGKATEKEKAEAK